MTKPCLQWPGSKARIASRIVEVMRDHQSYLEPFAGSLAVLLSKPSVQVEMINDRYEMLITFYRVLREQPDALVRALMLTPYARQELLYSSDFNEIGLSDLERARRFFVHINQSFVSSNGNGSWTSTTNSVAGHSNASKWARFQERLYEVADRLTGVQIECCDWRVFLNKLSSKDDEHCVVYCDPPYMSANRNGSRYEHDMATIEEHEEMVHALIDLATSGRQVLLSGYANEHYERWLNDWDRVEFSTTRNSTSGRGSIKQQEVLWSSLPSKPEPEGAVTAAEVTDDGEVA